MTNVQKAFCILLSMCFFATLAVLPGTFFTGENVYRHLPLYRFLEKRAHMSSCEDIETYKKIAGENGKYLGERAQSEQLLAEKSESEELQTPESTPVPEETAIPSKTVKSAKISESEQASEKTEKTHKPEKTTVSPENPEPDKSQKPPKSAAQNVRNIQDSTETIAAAVPHPMIDLSPEKLADYNYLLGQFYIVDSNTEADAVQINAEDFLKQDLKITKETDTPQILIYHSHSQETFADSREGEESDTIVGVGDYLTQLLTENYGYQVVHLKEQFDMAGGELDRSAAYATRWVAKNIVAAGLAKQCEVQVAYAIGVAKPVSIMVDTFGTGTVSDEKIEQAVEKVFDLTPAAIIRDLDLRKPIYRKLAAYGHMGREDLGVKWENTDRVDALKAAVAAL